MSETTEPNNKDKDRDYVAPETGGEPSEPTEPKEPGIERILIGTEGHPGPFIENPELHKQPGEMMETVASGTSYYAEGMLVEDKDGRLGQISRVELIETKWRPGKRDLTEPFITQPEKYANPRVTVRYADGKEKRFSWRQLPVAAYKTPLAIGLRTSGRDVEFRNLITLELRGHQYSLGELVSFGNGVGILAAIFPTKQEGEETFVGIVAERERGKGGPRFVWKVRAADMDYIEHDAKGAIRRNLDNTIFKPTLSESPQTETSEASQ